MSQKDLNFILDSVADHLKDDIFELGLDRENKYELEGGSLEGKYKDWQKKLHPDLVHNKSQVSVLFYYYIDALS